MPALNTSSPSPFELSGMTAANARHEAPMMAFLEAVIAQPSIHAKFMNMLSMLEHMGSRKIMLSQMHRTLTEDSLKHLAEEARHAYFFKRQAERIAGRALPGYTDENTLCRVPAAMYFGRLDAGIAARVIPPCIPPASGGKSLREAETRGGEVTANDANLAYPWVSMIVELRACWLYHMYQKALQKAGSTLSLKSLLAEEDLHLAEMFAMVGGDTPRLQELSALETSLYGKFWEKLSAVLSTELHTEKAA